MVNVYIRNMDGEAYVRAKMLAVRLGKTVGEVVSDSIRAFQTNPKKKGLGAVKSVDLGAGTENLSSSIDEILYGTRK